MNPRLELLHAYPFERLAKLKAGISPPPELAHIALSIGEPKHPTPDFLCQNLSQNCAGLAQYPSTKGSDELRQAIADWLSRRFKLQNIQSDQQILPVNGTREALFAFAQAVIDSRQPRPLVLIPNPFYQIYEGAVLLAGADLVYLNCEKENDFICDFDQVSEQTWLDCQLIYICSPANPTGAVLNQTAFEKLIKLALKYDFIIASDECYSEIYANEQTPPLGLLEVAESMGLNDYKNCIIFHSLSKRSNAPGLRSGFVAGDADIIQAFFRYRTYHGCAMPPHHQALSILAWQDEQHVLANRQAYNQKFDIVIKILIPVIPVFRGDGGFYLWIETPIDDIDFAQKLYSEQNMTVLPGQFLSRETKQGNPGKKFIRLALVASIEECTEAAQRLKQFITNLENINE